MYPLKKILAISGSTKKNSSNAAILQFIARQYQHVLEVEVYDALDQLPHFCNTNQCRRCLL